MELPAVDLCINADIVIQLSEDTGSGDAGGLADIEEDALRTVIKNRGTAPAAER